MRKPPTEEVETEILVASKRRCALCYGLYGDLTPKRGQFAHVDRDSSRSEADDLCYLCLPHHDEYDSRNSQSKRFTPAELRRHRSDLYAYIRSGRPLAEVIVPKRAEDKPFFALVGNSFSAGVIDLHLRNEGAPVNCLDFHPKTEGVSIPSWYPRSLPQGELLRAKVHISSLNPDSEYVFQLRVRDRSDAERVFEIHIDFRRRPVGFDSLEVL
jgi:hypothetical protein